MVVVKLCQAFVSIYLLISLSSYKNKLYKKLLSKVKDDRWSKGGTTRRRTTALLAESSASTTKLDVWYCPSLESASIPVSSRQRTFERHETELLSGVFGPQVQPDERKRRAKIWSGTK